MRNRDPISSDAPAYGCLIVLGIAAVALIGGFFLVRWLLS
jgi:hypothetical protein